MYRFLRAFTFVILFLFITYSIFSAVNSRAQAAAGSDTEIIPEFRVSRISDFIPALESNRFAVGVEYNGVTYTAWSDNREGHDSHDIFFAKSFNRGGSWSASVRVTDDPYEAMQLRPSIDVCQNKIAIAKTSVRWQGQLYHEISVTMSEDGGSSWGTSTYVFGSFYGNRDPIIKFNQQNCELHMVWSARHRAMTLMYATSPDGYNWGTARMIEENEYGAYYYPHDLEIDAESNLHLVYVRPEIGSIFRQAAFYKYIPTNSKSFETPSRIQIVSSADYADSVQVEVGSISAFPSTKKVFVAWNGRYGGGDTREQQFVYMAQMHVGGSGFSGLFTVSRDGPVVANATKLDLSSGILNLSWIKDRYEEAGASSIMIARSISTTVWQYKTALMPRRPSTITDIGSVVRSGNTISVFYTLGNNVYSVSGEL